MSPWACWWKALPIPWPGQSLEKPIDMNRLWPSCEGGFSESDSNLNPNERGGVSAA